MKKALAVLVLLALLLLAGFWWQQDGSSAAGERGWRQPVVSLQMAEVTRQVLPFYLNALGEVEPLHSVTTRPQVSGLLEKVFFHEDGRRTAVVSIVDTLYHARLLFGDGEAGGALWYGRQKSA